MGAALLSTIETILAEIVTDSNAELDQLPEDFHYRGRLRDQTWSDKLAYKILATIKKLVSGGSPRIHKGVVREKPLVLTMPSTADVPFPLQKSTSCCTQAAESMRFKSEFRQSEYLLRIGD